MTFSNGGLKIFFNPGFLGFVLLFLVFGADRALGDDRVSCLLEEIHNKSLQIKTLRCAFDQEKHLSIFSRPVLFEGVMVLERPDKLRWEYLKPVPSVFIFNGDKGVRCGEGGLYYRFDLRKDPLMRMVATQLWTWAAGEYFRLEKTYDMSLADTQPGLVLIPKDKNQRNVVSRIIVSFEKETLYPRKVTIFEPGGDYTVISFRELRINTELSPYLFDKCF